jgi:hypothetical protein
MSFRMAIWNILELSSSGCSRFRRNVRFCRVVRTDCRPGRVYFLTLLEPLTGTTGLWPYRQVGQSRNRRQTEPTVDWFTAHAAWRAYGVSARA